MRKKSSSDKIRYIYQVLDHHICVFRLLFVHLHLFWQSLLSDIEELRSVCAEHHTAPSAESPYDPTSAGTTTDGQDGHQPEGPEQSENLYETMGESKAEKQQ